jgi:hypothetical protein
MKLAIQTPYCSAVVCRVSDEEKPLGKFPISSFDKIEGVTCPD